MRLLDWLSGLAASLTRSKKAADNLGDTLETIDAKIRDAAGLPPRGPDGEPVNMLPPATEARPVSNGTHTPADPPVGRRGRGVRS